MKSGWRMVLQAVIGKVAVMEKTLVGMGFWNCPWGSQRVTRTRSTRVEAGTRST